MSTEHVSPLRHIFLTTLHSPGLCSRNQIFIKLWKIMTNITTRDNVKFSKMCGVFVWCYTYPLTQLFNPFFQIKLETDFLFIFLTHPPHCLSDITNQINPCPFLAVGLMLTYLSPKHLHLPCGCLHHGFSSVPELILSTLPLTAPFLFIQNMSHGAWKSDTRENVSCWVQIDVEWWAAVLWDGSYVYLSS